MGDKTWPVALFLGFLVVVAVNMTMIWIATSGSDPVVESYTFGSR